MNEHEYTHAAGLLSDPLLIKLFDKLERDAIEDMIAAPPLDHEMRAFHSFRVRAVRDLRAKLSLLADEAKASRKFAIA